MSAESYFKPQAEQFAEEANLLPTLHSKLSVAIDILGTRPYPDSEEDDFREVLSIPFIEGWTVDIQELTGALEDKSLRSPNGEKLGQPISICIHGDNDELYGMGLRAEVVVADNGMIHRDTGESLSVMEARGLLNDIDSILNFNAPRLGLAERDERIPQ